MPPPGKVIAIKYCVDESQTYNLLVHLRHALAEVLLAVTKWSNGQMVLTNKTNKTTHLVITLIHYHALIIATPRPATTSPSGTVLVARHNGLCRHRGCVNRKQAQGKASHNMTVDTTKQIEDRRQLYDAAYQVSSDAEPTLASQ